jgi:hypothetical protein
VNGIEAQLGNKVEIIRLDLLGKIGRQAAREYSVQIVPATLLFDSQGAIVIRKMGVPDPALLVETVRYLLEPRQTS